MNFLKKLFVAITFLSIATISNTNAQCETWVGSPDQETAENAHVVYRAYLKDNNENDLAELSQENFDVAFKNWETAYTLAPKADGTRTSHYRDGITLYKALALRTEDVAKKEEYGKAVMRIYDEYMECYPGKEDFILGRRAYDMFYTDGYGFSLETLEAMKAAMDAGDMDTEFIIFDPLGQLLVYLYQSEQVDKETVQMLYGKITEIVEHNVSNEHKYKEYYESSYANMNIEMDKIANDIFDCAYFKKRLLPAYEENKEDWEKVEYIWLKILSQGCEESDPELAQLKGTYEQMYADIQQAEEDQRRIDDPCFDGIKLQEEKLYDQALARYNECLETNDDPEVKAQILYSMAFIQTWELGQYSTAISNARKAASLKSGWGKPYILIGDVYAKMSRSCDDWNQRLAIIAVIDKYSYAKSIDSDVADEANRRIGNYNGSLPARQDGFMRDVSEGQSVSASCVGETVTVRFRD